jgi:hypothetical protein
LDSVEPNKLFDRGRLKPEFQKSGNNTIVWAEKCDGLIRICWKHLKVHHCRLAKRGSSYDEQNVILFQLRATKHAVSFFIDET